MVVQQMDLKSQSYTLWMSYGVSVTSRSAYKVQALCLNMMAASGRSLLQFLTSETLCYMCMFDVAIATANKNCM